MADPWLLLLQSHPWSLIDAESGKLVQDYTAREGFQLVPIQEAEDGSSQPAQASLTPLLDDRLPYTGWDGLGENADAYVAAKVSALASRCIRQTWLLPQATLPCTCLPGLP